MTAKPAAVRSKEYRDRKREREGKLPQPKLANPQKRLITFEADQLVKIDQLKSDKVVVSASEFVRNAVDLLLKQHKDHLEK